MKICMGMLCENKIMFFFLTKCCQNFKKFQQNSSTELLAPTRLWKTLRTIAGRSVGCRTPSRARQKRKAAKFASCPVP